MAGGSTEGRLQDAQNVQSVFFIILFTVTYAMEPLAA